MGKLSILVLGLCALAATATPAYRYRRAAHHEYKMCVPDELMTDCTQMASQETKSAAKIICIPARDRMECLEKIQQREADFGAVDPEDMYVASKIPDEDFNIFQEVRTKEEPDAEFRYEAVAVIHKDLEIVGIHGLHGLKSCHTGVGRNVGYKIPLTKLRNMGIIGGLNDTEMSPRENELKAFSTLFSKACIVGKWSADPAINKKLKSKYSNLCALCEHPDICDYPDKFSGYDGALRCLAHNGGQIAWTKVIYVKKFFGLAVGTTPAVPTDEDPSNYAYLCPDGSRVPVTGTPCTFAARPWQGFMTNADVVKTIDELRTKILNLNTVGEKNHAHWLESILVVNDKTLIKDNKLISPKDYLDKSNYTDVIERQYGPPVKVVRFCTTSDVETEKCNTFSKAAYSRDIRPRFECIQQENEHDCMKAIQNSAADIMTLDPATVSTLKEKYNLKPILTEDHELSKGKFYAVAVVKSNSNFQDLNSLKGKKSCHAEYSSFASYRAPLNVLIKQGLIKKSACPYEKALSEFFSGGSCVPGSKLQDYNVEEKTAEKLCSLCAGNLDSNDSNPLESKCVGDIKEAFYGYSGAFRCLTSGHGDVAFVKHTTVKENTDGHNKNKWAADLKSTDYELLCPKGGRAPLDQYEECNLAKVPMHMVVTSNAKTDNDIDEIKHVMTSAAQLFGKRPDIFKMFGMYNGKQDLLFKDSTTGLISYDEENQQEYTKILTETTC